MKVRLFILSVLSSVLLIACGSASTSPRAKTGPDHATEAATDKEGVAPTEPVAKETTAVDTPDKPTHLCDRPIETPGEVWPRVEAVRALSEAERFEKCGLNLVDVFNRWRPLPSDLLVPIVAKAAENQKSLNEWITQRLNTKTAAIKTIIVADILGRWVPGKDLGVVSNAIGRWKTMLAARNIDVDDDKAEFGKLFSQLVSILGLLKDIEEIYRLRCELEVNPMGFSIACTPIHTAGRKITISWQQAIRDGILEDLQVTSCTGKSCKKLKQGALKLSEKIKACLIAIDNLDYGLIGEMLRVHLVLPPFKALSL